MGCVLHYKGQEFDSKEALAEFIMNQIEEGTDQESSDPESFHPEDRLELEKIAEREAYDEIYKKWYQSTGFANEDEVKLVAFKEGNDNSVNLEESIKKMSELFDVKVILDKSIDTLGELLPANHPLAIESGKPVILVNPNLAKSETVFHEFAHLYVDLLDGSNNSTVKAAMDLLQGTELFNTTALDYPELSGEMLNREVLAKALGMQADEIFGKEIVPMSAFNRLVNIIMDRLAELLGVRQNAVRRLAKELISKDLQQSPVQKYNTLITQKQKVAGTSQADVIDFLDNFVKKNDGFASIEQKASTKTGRISVSNLLKTSLHSTNSSNAGRRGDISLKFVAEEFTEDNMAMQLYAHKIPQSLDRALNEFLKANDKIDNKVNRTWYHWVKNDNFFARQKKDEARLAFKNSVKGNMDAEEEVDTAPEMGNMDYLVKNIETISAMAEEYQAGYDRGSIAGDIVHDATQLFIEDGVWGEDVDSSDNKFFKYIENLKNEGELDKSKFYTEIAVYDEVNNITARIDLLEIKEDGTFVIHDYKTMKTMNSSYGEKGLKSEDEMFVQTGYVSQLMVYGKILEGYGLKPAATPFNLIATQVSYGRLDGEEFRDVSVSGVRSFRFNKSARGNTGIKSKLFEADQKISRTLRTRHRKLTGTQEKNLGYEKLIDKVSKDMIIYNNLARKQGKNINDQELRKMAALLESIKEDKISSDKIKIKRSVEALIEGIADQLIVLEGSIADHNEADFDKDYMYSYRYIVQAMDNLEILKDTMENDKDNEIGFENKENKIHDVEALIANISSSKQYYKRQVENHAAYQLANNSNYQRGLYKARFQVRLKKAGVTDKIERERQVEALLKENGDEIFDKEMEYWQTQYREGILDLRSWEYQFADPGISKSQFVQVTKNLIDKAGTNTRVEIDKLMPEIFNWNENISYNKSGSTREIWKDVLEKRKVRGVNGETIEDLNGSVITEFTSDYREQMYEYLTQKEHYLDELRAVKNIEKKTPKDIAEQARIESILEIFFEDRKKQMAKNEKIKGMRTLRVNPAFEKLSDEKKKDLRFIHKNLREADNRVQNSKLKLTSYFFNESNSAEDVEAGKAEYIYNLPRQRMSGTEASNSLAKTVQNAYSRIKDIVRPAADREDTTFEESVDMTQEGATEKEDSTDSFNSSMSDIENNEVYDVPVYFRNSLGKDRAIQSFDIPSLLADNHGTTVTYQQNKMIEADLFMISESLRLQEKILKTDGVFNGKVLGAFNRPRKSDENYVFKAVKNQIENRIYGRHFSGIYTKGSYAMANLVGNLKSITSISVLAGNFMSALNTSGSGSVYRFLEGEVGEHFNRKDWANGSKKTYSDVANILKDTQRPFPQSKTVLLIRMLGMDHQYSALTNKFVKKTFASKNLDQGTLFALTSIAETNITAHLMYSLTGGIKMMNKDGMYINKEGVIVKDKEDAMTFDEAYEVVDGVLTLNEHVGYTDKDFHNKFNEDGDINMVALTNVSGYVKSVYADLFGQYDHNMKSVFETNVLGAATMSMKKWLPRGVNRRFRGIGSLMAWGDNLLDFDQLNEPENEHLKFYSQDQQQFQEGYFVTAARYVRLLAYEMRKTGTKLSLIEKNKQLRDSMSEHEIANLKRAAMDSMYMVMMYAVKTMLWALAESIGTDPRDRVKKERAYFAAYLALKMYHESNAFVNPFSLAKTVVDPSVPSGQLFKMAGLADQLFGFSYDKDSDFGFSFNITEDFKSGDKKGKSKAWHRAKAVMIPGWSNYSRASGIIGWDAEPDSKISDSAKFYANQSK